MGAVRASHKRQSQKSIRVADALLRGLHPRIGRPKCERPTFPIVGLGLCRRPCRAQWCSDTDDQRAPSGSRIHGELFGCVVYVGTIVGLASSGQRLLVA